MVASTADPLRPSFLTQFDTVIDLSATSSEAFHRSLLVRGMKIVLADRVPGQIMMHCVLLDRTYAAWRLTRRLLQAGHSRILVVEALGQSALAEAAKAAAAVYAPEATVQSIVMENIATILDPSNTAILCDIAFAQRLAQLQTAIPVSQRPSIAAVGLCDGMPQHTGIYVTPADMATAIVELLKNAQMHRPVVLHLSGNYIDRETIRPVLAAHDTAVLPAALSA